MNNEQLELAVMTDEYCRLYFKGIFASDHLPSKLFIERPCGLIANTDPSAKPGEHWVFFWLTPDAVYFIDSFGKTPIFYTLLFEEFMEKQIINCCSLLFNPYQLQSEFTSVCGEYCLLIFYYLARNPLDDPKTIIKKIFKLNDSGRNLSQSWRLRNDVKVFKFVKKHFTIPKVLPFLDCNSQICKSWEETFLKCLGIGYGN